MRGGCGEDRGGCGEDAGRMRGGPGRMRGGPGRMRGGPGRMDGGNQFVPGGGRSQGLHKGGGGGGMVGGGGERGSGDRTAVDYGAVGGKRNKMLNAMPPARVQSERSAGHGESLWVIFVPPPRPPFADAHPQRAQVSPGVGKPPHGLCVCIGMHPVNGTGQQPRLRDGRPPE